MLLCCAVFVQMYLVQSVALVTSIASNDLLQHQPSAFSFVHISVTVGADVQVLTDADK